MGRQALTETRERAFIKRYDLTAKAEVLAKRTKAEIRRIFDSYDMAEYEARLHAADMVTLLVAFANDPTVPVETRRACANDIRDRAYGKPVTKMQLQRLDPAEETDGEITIEATIEAAKAAAQKMADLDRYLGKVPPDQWPQWVHDRLGEGGAAAYPEIGPGQGAVPTEDKPT